MNKIGFENINFNVPALTGNEGEYISKTLRDGKFSGNRFFNKKCTSFLEERLGTPAVMLTPSGTSALEMAAMLCNIEPGDEVIMSSYGFTSTANAFVLRGARIVFVDIRPDTMNLDEELIERAITKKTKVIVPMHYAGVACEMNKIQEIAKERNFFIVEDAAQAILSTYKKKHCGTFGELGCLSFHETKNVHCGEGGAILINNKEWIKRAEIIQEKGTNRSRFFKGEIDKYTWMDIGSSYLLGEISAAFLSAQFEKIEDITSDRLSSWNLYYKSLKPLEELGFIELPSIPEPCLHNGHIFYIKTMGIAERKSLINFLNKQGINAVFHYVPLHSSPAGRMYGRFNGDDVWTTRESERIIRLPLYYNIDKNIEFVVRTIFEYFK